MKRCKKKKLKPVKVDVDELEDLAAEQEVKAMPTFSQGSKNSLVPKFLANQKVEFSPPLFSHFEPCC